MTDQQVMVCQNSTDSALVLYKEAISDETITYEATVYSDRKYKFRLIQRLKESDILKNGEIKIEAEGLPEGLRRLVRRSFIPVHI